MNQSETSTSPVSRADEPAITSYVPVLKQIRVQLENWQRNGGTKSSYEYIDEAMSIVAKAESTPPVYFVRHRQQANAWSMREAGSILNIELAHPDHYEVRHFYPAPILLGAFSASDQSEGMPDTQEPKYGIRENRLFNRASGEFIPADEPVFIFRARDSEAWKALAHYMGLFGPGEHRVAIESRVRDFRMFASDNPSRMKWPDTDIGATVEAIPKQTNAPSPGTEINGPLRDNERNEIRALASTLHGGHFGDFDEIIRAASVRGYINGRKDFGTPRRSDTEIVKQTEELAAALAALDGHQNEGLYHKSASPRAAAYWAKACTAQELLTATDPNDAVSNLEEEVAAEPTGTSSPLPGMLPLSDGAPSPEEHNRVLVYTDGVDFNGQQYFDIRTEELWEQDPDARSEVADAATHWMPRPQPR